MSSLKRFVACASAVALATGTTLAGAGFASAQDEGDTGSLSSSSIDFADIGDSLQTASDALKGPVTVAANAEGGPTVTYTNEGEATEQCLGFTAPYSTIVEQDLDTNYDEDDLLAAIALVQALEAGGGVTYLLGDEDGEPTALLDEDAESGQNFVGFVLPWVFPSEVPVPSVDVAPGEDVSWTAGSPDTPALAVIACRADVEGAGMETNIGIDPQVVADQINGRIPGGSLDIVSADQISPGSVDTGIQVLGSLESASGDNGNGNGGDDNGDENGGGDDN